MNCWHCERPAHGACIFCGRAICKEHVREMPHIVALYRDSKNAQKAIVTARALRALRRSCRSRPEARRARSEAPRRDL